MANTRDLKSTPEQLEYARSVRDQRRLSGLCIYCGHLPDPDYATCYPCRSKYLKGGPYGCDKPGRNRSRKNQGLPDRRKKEHRNKGTR